MDVLKETQNDLQNGKQKLDAMLQKLEKEQVGAWVFHALERHYLRSLSMQNEVEQNITVLQEKTEEVKASLEKLEGKEDLPIDDIVVPAAPLYRQSVHSDFLSLGWCLTLFLFTGC